MLRLSENISKPPLIPVNTLPSALKAFFATHFEKPPSPFYIPLGQRLPTNGDDTEPTYTNKGQENRCISINLNRWRGWRQVATDDFLNPRIDVKVVLVTDDAVRQDY